MEKRTLALPLAALEWAAHEDWNAPTGSGLYGFPIDAPLPRNTAPAALDSPRARVQLTTSAPERPPSVLTLFIAEGGARIEVLRGDGALSGVPLALSALAQALARRLRGAEGDGPASRASFWASHLRLLAILWPAAERSADEPLSAEQALLHLGRSGLSPAQAASALDALAEAGVIAAGPRHLEIAPPARPWLECLWSPHRVEIARTELDSSASGTSQAGAAAERLLFVGPPGQRALCDALPAVGRWGPSGGVASKAAERLVTLERLGPGALAEPIGRLLRAAD